MMQVITKISGIMHGMQFNSLTIGIPKMALYRYIMPTIGIATLHSCTATKMPMTKPATKQ